MSTRSGYGSTIRRSLGWLTIFLLALVGTSQIEVKEKERERAGNGPQSGDSLSLYDKVTGKSVAGAPVVANLPQASTAPIPYREAKVVSGTVTLEPGTANQRNTPAAVGPAVQPLDYSLPTGEPIIVALTFNQIARGEYPVILQQGGGFLLRGTDLTNLGVTGSYGTPIIISGKEYFSLRGLGATNIVFNEAMLALSAELPSERLPKQTIDFLGQQPPGVIYPRADSAYLNYRLQNSGDDAGSSEAWLAGAEIGIRFSDVLFQTESAYLRYGDKEQRIRYGTSFTHDNRETMQRLIVGDFTASSGTLGNTVNFGGISFSKSYAIDPYFARRPMAGFVTTVSSPSVVEIYRDETRLRTETVGPGELEVSNIDYYGGRHDLEMVIRDSFGREQRIANPYYFSSLNLRQGLHDYSYNAGRIRRGVGTSNDEYGDWAVSGYHRYGLSNRVTIGLRGEAGGGTGNLGPTMVVRMDRWGTLGATLSASQDEGTAGWASSMAYEYQQSGLRAYGSWREYSKEYGIVGRQEGADRPERELMAALGYGVRGFGNIGVSVRQLSQYQGVDQMVSTLTYSRSIARRFQLMTTLSRIKTDEDMNYFYIGLSYHPGGKVHASVRHQKSESISSDALEVGTNTPVGEGVGYRMTAERYVTDAGEGMRVTPQTQYNGRYGIYTARIQAERQPGGGRRTGYHWGVSGGVGYVGERVNFSRPISDSFALVDVGDIEGVRVYQNSQEMGRTDEEGELFLPNLGSYQVNRIAVDDRDIPLDRSIDNKEVQLSPPLRSGTHLRVGVERYQAVSGFLRLKRGAKWQAVEYAELQIDTEDGKLRVPSGHGGEFYLENLKPGRYRAAFDYQGTHCAFELVVPETREMVTELGELNVCEIAQ